MKLTFFGGANKVTGSCALLTIEGKKILIDCGADQDDMPLETLEEKIDNLPKIDCCFLTHAHIDHSGLLPLLVKKNKTNQIWSTPATKELTEILLYDYLKIQKDNSENTLFKEKDIEKLFLIWKTIDENINIKLNGNIEATFYYNAHIIGSTSIEIKSDEGKIFFTGDIGTKCQELIVNKYEYPEDIDYLVIESTYGNKNHNIKDKKRLPEIIEKTCKQGGKILIPTFAIGRLQEILYTLKKENIQYPIYIDTPLGNKINHIFQKYITYLNDTIMKENINLFNSYESIENNKDSIVLANKKEPCIIISSSGMLQGGRILNHLETIKDDSLSTIVFVSYQAENTRGRQIYDGIEKLSCNIEKLDAFSSHADQTELLEYIEKLPNIPSKIFIVHGEDKQRNALKEKIMTYKIKTELPLNIYDYSLNNVELTRKTIISIPLNFTTVKNLKAALCEGYIIDRGNTYELVSTETYKKIANQIETTNVKKLIDNFLPENIPEMSEKDIKDSLSLLFSTGVLTKKKILILWTEILKGRKSALIFINKLHGVNENHQGKKWNKPYNEQLQQYFSEKDAEFFYNLAYNTILNLLKYDNEKIYEILKEYNNRLYFF